ncbi:aminoglycoside 6-adenylyltransferase [Enterococcus wangshanyuanii]|uniref:Aminoglycoside 6-adenylyltransferase n=1 Tax=Enterococcus wangshanyuanii TaxID=2005703 RepID=A0ABQ1PV37_9ENTE|nr:aminoglycoside 6-adenylyltransferase [Enterococcus wangshanyuanii]GGD04057.1 aminoglycoside 6-adenylyltransferase [Enterococcus wangshanyuanii]
MRTEQEMFRLILDTAKEDARILAVGMNGSRTNQRVPKDSFQDFDIVYIVDDVEPFLEDQQWIDRFGTRLIMQTPEAMTLFPPTENGRFTYLMLFEDGNRIDLTLCPKEQANDWNEGDRLAEILLDKEQLLPVLSKATDQDYWIKKPTQEEFLDCCNEFWWVSTYVVKGLCRNELLYAADPLYENCRKELLRLLSWQVGAENDYMISVGKNYKYLPNYLSDKNNECLLKTMRMSNGEQLWESLILQQKTFSSLARTFSRMNHFLYDHIQAEKVIAYTKKHYVIGENRQYK